MARGLENYELVDLDDMEIVRQAAHCLAIRLAFGGSTETTDPDGWALARCLAALSDRLHYTGDSLAWIERIIPPSERKR
jgi:hypothetical protein